MAVLLEFPVTALKVRNPAIAPAYNTRPGHEATNGMRRSTGMSGAQWKMKFDVLVHDEASVRTMRAFLFQMEADSSLVRIRMPDRYGIDGPFSLATQSVRDQYPDGIPFATDAMYATGVGHAVPTLETYFSADADLGAREVYVTETGEIPAGCAISIDEFCYGIGGSWIEDGQQRLRLSPVLRKPASAGATISLAPVFVGFCVTDSPGYEALVQGWYGEHTLEFIEDLTRLVESVD
ncbi:hypothetical protein J2046_000257 [Rhizobium petrolearium]|uniref:hypothetical protein n=1 Tax=Neorhizobium petrolearium TaxID=515361 RepID=UPI001AE92F55|nr:hypothetical protein [Neorhizobium petrolearium]MBP1842013.1 hypothetical protein [Neorhizobium petrolearium]